ncbi:hypothetical protein Nepgr_020170 [Nepenthes gracilis]|uniref:Uncharacterized protein n=1 Tax=Nepenthes gracilis TaxID=150966 RepID=A0AAD3XVS9_NEPGR|nr:hypothetical protein Nepgr_020170 [Nepenthes gracilis]
MYALHDPGSDHGVDLVGPEASLFLGDQDAEYKPLKEAIRPTSIGNQDIQNPSVTQIHTPSSCQQEDISMIWHHDAEVVFVNPCSYRDDPCPAPGQPVAIGLEQEDFTDEWKATRGFGTSIDLKDLSFVQRTKLTVRADEDSCVEPVENSLYRIGMDSQPPPLDAVKPILKSKVGSTIESSISPDVLYEDVDELRQLVGVTYKLDSVLTSPSLKPATEECEFRSGVLKHSPYPVLPLAVLPFAEKHEPIPDHILRRDISAVRDSVLLCNIASSERRETGFLRAPVSFEDASIDHRGSSSRGEGAGHDMAVPTFDDVESKMAMIEAQIAAKAASPNCASRIATKVEHL